MFHILGHCCGRWSWQRADMRHPLLLQQWPNVWNIGPIYEISRYYVTTSCAYDWNENTNRVLYSSDTLRFLLCVLSFVHETLLILHLKHVRWLFLDTFWANKESRANLGIADFQRCKIWDHIFGNSSVIIGPQPFLSHLQHSSGLITSLYFSPAAKHLIYCNICFCVFWYFVPFLSYFEKNLIFERKYPIFKKKFKIFNKTFNCAKFFCFFRSLQIL